MRHSLLSASVRKRKAKGGMIMKKRLEIGKKTAQLLLAALFCLLPFTSAYAAKTGEEDYVPQTAAVEEIEEETQETDVSPASVPSAPQKEAADLQPETESKEAPTALAAGDVAIDEANFPDAVFRAYISKHFDTDHDSILTPEECGAVSSINVSFSQVTGTIFSLEGIGFFPNLTFLKCNGNAITSLDMSGNPKLEQLICENNQISSLNVTENPQLKTLECYNDPLTELDLSGNPLLSSLSCGSGRLTELDLSHNPNLISFTYLGGNIGELDVTHAAGLQSLICVGSKISSLDLSGNPQLSYLSLKGDRLTRLDLSHNPQLSVLEVNGNELLTLDLSNNPNLSRIEAGNNALISLHMGTNTAANVDGQKAYTIKLAQGETSFDLTQLDPAFDGTAVSNLKNAVLNGTVLKNLTVGMPVSYDYTSNGVTLHAKLDVVEGNAWITPLSIQNWTFGETPSKPHAQARLGTVRFLYGRNGVFTENIPQSAGTWTVRAVVDGTDDYPGLEAETEFEIYKAVPAYTVPQTLSGTYGDILRDISLGTGFSWTDGSLSVGNAGEHTFEVTYTPADTADYVTVEHIPVHVIIRPKDGTGFAISPLPLQNAEDADSIVIKDGSTVLERGKDYTVTEERQGTGVLVTIQYIGNYTGTVTLRYPVPGEGADESGIAPRTDDASGGPAAYILAAAALLAILGATFARRAGKTK